MLLKPQCRKHPGEEKDGFEGLQPHFAEMSNGKHWVLLRGASLPWSDLRVVQCAPAAVRVPRAQALCTGRVLFTGLHGHTGHLQGQGTSTASAGLVAKSS